MGRLCTICQHPQRQEIEKTLVGAAAIREIAAQFRVSEDALSRHKAAHLPLTLANAEETRQVAQAKDLVAHALDVVQQLKAANALTWRIAQEAREAGERELVLRALDRIQRQIELQAKLLGDLHPEGSVKITLQAEWIELRTVIMAALAAPPEAQAAVVEALRRVRA